MLEALKRPPGKTVAYGNSTRDRIEGATVRVSRAHIVEPGPVHRGPSVVEPAVGKLGPLDEREADLGELVELRSALGLAGEHHERTCDVIGAVAVLDALHAESCVLEDSRLVA